MPPGSGGNLLSARSTLKLGSGELDVDKLPEGTPSAAVWVMGLGGKDLLSIGVSSAI